MGQPEAVGRKKGSGETTREGGSPLGRDLTMQMMMFHVVCRQWKMVGGPGAEPKRMKTQLSGNFPGGRVFGGVGRTWEDLEYGCQLKYRMPSYIGLSDKQWMHF